MLGAWLVTAVAMLLASLCSAADGALLAPQRPGEPAGGANGAAQREQRHRALTMARVLAYLAVGAAFARAIGLERLASGAELLVSLAVATVVVGIAEGAARAVGYAQPTRTLTRLSSLVSLLCTVQAPVVAIGARLETLLYRLIPPTPIDEEERETSAEQFREVVAAEAEVTREEEAIIHGVFSLGDTEVREIMVPRVDIVGIEVGTPWSEVLDRVRSSEHARFPVYDETLDNVIGILYAKDLLPAAIADEEPADGWRTLVRPAVFVPTSKIIDDQLRDFKASHTHIAIVSDEYGGTAGLVTIEDVLEEIVGEIRDEYDVEEADVEREGDSRFWVSGKLTVDELSELLDAPFEAEDVTTVGGLVYDLFGRVPRAGESTVAGGFRIVVERVRHRRIERVYFERLEPVGSGPNE